MGEEYDKQNDADDKSARKLRGYWIHYSIGTGKIKG